MNFSLSRFAVVLPLALVALGSVACGSSVKYVDFKVPEGNREVTVRKFYNDGLSAPDSQDPTERAYQAVVHGDIKEGVRLAKEANEAQPTYWTHYNLGILYEANRQWPEAKLQMEEAHKLDPNGSGAKEEIAFINAHK